MSDTTPALAPATTLTDRTLLRMPGSVVDSALSVQERSDFAR